MGCSSSKGNLVRVDLPEATSPDDVDFSLNEPLLLRLVSACNMPSMDLTSESDVYAIVSLTPKDAKKPSATHKWPVRWDATSPLWDSCRLFSAPNPIKGSDKIDLRFLDCDDNPNPLDGDDLIGTASCSVAQLPVGKQVTLPIGLSASANRYTSDTGAASCVVMRESATMAPPRKTIYIVRHGESVWNKAQNDKDVVAMLSDVDHPLNEMGRAQAEGLRGALAAAVASGAPVPVAIAVAAPVAASTPEQLAAAGIVEDARSAGLDTSKAVPAWLANLDLPAPTAAALRAAVEAVAEVAPEVDARAPSVVEPAAVEPAISPVSSMTDEAQRLLRAELIMCSPLTRAIETCLIGLQPLLLPAHPVEGGSAAETGSSGRHGVLLNPNLREKRNFGGKDSSGKWVGSSIQSGVHAELTKLYADTPSVAESLKKVPLELSYVQNQWWLGSKESEKHVAERIGELLAQVRARECHGCRAQCSRRRSI